MIENKTKNKNPCPKDQKKKKNKSYKRHSSTVYKCGLRRMQQIGVLLMF